MKKIISIALIGFSLSGCAMLSPHKMDIEQGNIITTEDVSRLKLGMSEAEVKNIMGTPLLINIFRDNRLDYVYTFRSGKGEYREKKVLCTFRNGRLSSIDA